MSEIDPLLSETKEVLRLRATIAALGQQLAAAQAEIARLKGACVNAQDQLLLQSRRWTGGEGWVSLSVS